MNNITNHENMMMYVNQSLAKLEKHFENVGLDYKIFDKDGYDGAFYVVYELSMNDLKYTITISDIYQSHATNLFRLNYYTFTDEKLIQDIDYFIQQCFIIPKLKTFIVSPVLSFKGILKAEFDNKLVIQLPNYTLKIIEKREVKML